MLTLEQSICIVKEKLKELKFRKEPHLLYEPIDYILSIGGKRIRPALTLLACDLFGGDYMKSIDVAIGLEVFHNFTLVHDDIMDRSDYRRNQATVHKKWNNNIAILSGDAMIIKAYELICKADVDDLKGVLEIFNQTALQVCEGQQYDMDYELRYDVTEAEYLHMIELKTAVLIAASLKLGAILGRANKKQAMLLYDFGLNLGLGFQLQDDYLDAFGQSDVFGKPIGGDIANNKQTCLMIKALEAMPDKERSVFVDAMNNPGIDRSERIAIGMDAYEKYGVKDLAKKQIEYYFELAEAFLKRIDVESSLKNELLSFLRELSIRKK